MNREEQLRWEALTGRKVAIAAFLSPLLLLGGVIWSRSGFTNIPSGRTDLYLQQVHRHSVPFIGGTVMAALGTLLLIPILLYLYRVIRYRRKQMQAWVVYLAIIAPIAAGAVGIVQQVQIAHIADNFVAHPPGAISAAKTQQLQKITNPQDYLKAVQGLSTQDQADNRLKTTGVQVAAAVGEFANIALGGAFILIGLNGMRSGIFSKFMGILGAIIGGLFIIPIIADPAIIEFFWLIALGVLILNRWPGGRGPAWEAGEEIPWPTAQDRREEMEARKEGREPPRRRQVASSSNGAAEDEDDDAGEDDGETVTTTVRPHATQHSRSKKRKRKRRG